MLDQDFCIEKLDATISLIASLSAADYPHEDSIEAAQVLKEFYENERENLKSLPGARPDTILEFCRISNINIVKLKKFLGMLLRSSNLRNAFEIYFPIKIYAQQILGPTAKLILSSEWDFSPFIYPISATELKDFIFIGVPASESQNPLIIPLAGHELGHVVWRRTTAKANFDDRIKTVLLDQYRSRWGDFSNLFNLSINQSEIEKSRVVRNIWGKSLQLAQRQVEEVFCDYFGLHIFGTSFLHSFRYLISPSLGRYRSPEYPNIKDRAIFLKMAATSWNMSPQTDFELSFSEELAPMSRESRFIVEMADNTTNALSNELVSFVNNNTSGIARYDTGSQNELTAKSSLISLVPATAIDSVASIVNAAWSVRLDIDNWDILANVEDPESRRRQKIRVLRDLTLKSLEVYEFEKRLKKHAPQLQSTC